MGFHGFSLAAFVPQQRGVVTILECLHPFKNLLFD